MVFMRASSIASRIENSEASRSGKTGGNRFYDKLRNCVAVRLLVAVCGEQKKQNASHEVLANRFNLDGAPGGARTIPVIGQRHHERF